MERLDFWSAVSPEQALAAMLADDNVRRVEHVLLKLTPDPVYTPMILEAIRSGRLDLRLAVAWLASLLEVDLYLEVGARRGFSTAVVGAARSDASIYVFDMWVRNYVGVPNPGPRFVRSELERVGFKGDAHFINGNSHTTLPRFFGDSRYPAIDRILRRDTSAPNRDFDMVLIDGDHSIEGAYRDLQDTISRIRVGGAILFDDIAPNLTQFNEAELAAIREELGPDPHRRGGLLGVWRAIQNEYPNFRYFEFPQDSPGVAFAVRMS